MSNKDLKVLYRVASPSFFLIMIVSTFLIFNFLDIFIFEMTRSFHGVIFLIFKKIIDPLSDIFDPINIIIICLILIILSFNIKFLLQNQKKLELLREKTSLDYESILNSFDYYLVVCKHFVWSLAIAGIACNIIKYVMGVARPKYFFLEGFERIDFFNIYHKTNSFPSGHTQAAFTLAILLVIYLKKYHGFIIFVACLMGVSRIFMSMHFPSDIFFGAYLGALVPIFLYKVHYKSLIMVYDNDKLVNSREFIKLLYWRIFI